MFPPYPTVWFTVDNDNRLNSKEYDTPSPKMVWDPLLVLKIEVATVYAKPPPPPMPPLRLHLELIASPR